MQSFKGKKKITTEVLDPGTIFYFAEDYQQQYLAKPDAMLYCSADNLQIDLPPISEWAPDSGLQNLLPPSYWAKFSPKAQWCRDVIDQSNAQIKREEFEPSTGCCKHKMNSDPRKTRKMLSMSGKMQVALDHYVLKGNRIQTPFPKGIQTCVFGTGCFWGSEKGFWRMPGVYSTAVGYTGGTGPNPTYQEVCSGSTGHNEVVQVAWDPKVISFADILRQFWQSHDPTQGMGQGHDRGTQYRSGIYPTTKEQKDIALKSKIAYQKSIDEKFRGGNAIANFFRGKKTITTEVLDPDKTTFYFAEDYHQQYLAKPGARPYCSAEPLEIDLPPTSEWAPDSGVKNLLPPSYWAKFSPKPHCVIGQSNAQIKREEFEPSTGCCKHTMNSDPAQSRKMLSMSGKIKVALDHYVLKGNRMQAPFPKGIQTCVFGTGCFWGSVRTALTRAVQGVE